MAAIMGDIRYFGISKLVTGLLSRCVGVSTYRVFDLKALCLRLTVN